MGKGKLILICQSGGRFEKTDDGSLNYIDGKAEAVDINKETMFDALKLKLAEILNLDFNSLSIKYFLPGNKRTLINLSDDKALKRMYDFHESFVTAEVYVTGKEGFCRQDFATPSDGMCGIKLAETVAATVSPQHAAINTTTAAVDTASRVTSAPIGLDAVPVSVPKQSLSVKATSRSRKKVTPTKDFGSSSSAQAGRKTRSSSKAASSLDSLFAVPISISPDLPQASYANGVSVTNTSVAASSQREIVIALSANRVETLKSQKRSANSLRDTKSSARDTKRIKLQKEDVRGENLISIPIDIESVIGSPIVDSSSEILADGNSINGSAEDLVASWKEGITGVGQEFKDADEFRDALQKYAIACRFVYRLKKNDTTRASGNCVSEGCSWRIHASWVPSERVFKIKKMNKSHTCGGKSWETAHRAKNWLVDVIKDRLRDSPHHKPKDIANGILQDFGIKLNYTQVWRKVEEAREQLQGSYKESYTQLPHFCHKILEANPGSHINIFIDEGRKFQRLFLCYHASVHGFQNGCRPLIFLDSTPLKSKYHEILLTATAIDGDDGVFPVALAIVDIESNECWHWFLMQLRSAVSASRSITFVCDKDKELKNSVLEVFENAHFGYSIYYLFEQFMKNLKGPFHGEGKGSLPTSFMGAAQADRVDSFRMFTDKIKQVSTQTYDWLMQIEPESWANALFAGERYSQITFNVAGSYTNWIQEVRELPIIQKLEAVQSKIMKLISDRLNDSSSWCRILTPSKEKLLREESEKSDHMKVFTSSDFLFEVHDGSVNVVNILNRECSCLCWKPTEIPCRHAIAVFKCKGKSVYDYCSSYFTANSYRLTYSECIKPVPSITDEEQTVSDAEVVLPPCILRLSSEEKIAHKKAKGFDARTVMCSRCQGGGHNKRKCKENL